MKTGVILGFVLALIASGSPALAQRWGGGETLDRILPQIRAHHPGRLSDAEPFVGEDGDTHYRIKWMTPEGRIIYFDADGRSGRWTNSRGYEGGGNRGGYQDDGPPRDYYRGGDDGRSRDGHNWQGGDGRQNWNDNGGHGRQNWNDSGGRGSDLSDSRGGEWNGNGRGGRNWNGGGRGWQGPGGGNWNGGSHHHGGH